MSDTNNTSAVTDTTSITTAIGWDANGLSHKYTLKNYSDTGEDVPGYKVNQNKVPHLCFYSYHGENYENLLNIGLNTIIDSIGSGCTGNVWDNWRDGKSTINGVSTPYLTVPNNIYPALDNFTIAGGFTIGSISASDAMKEGGTKVMSLIDSAAGAMASFGEGINALTSGVTSAMKGQYSSEALSGALAGSAVEKGKLSSRFDEFPIFDPDGTKFKAPGSISLKFSLGSGNYFDGEVEVVRPIAAIENKIVPVLEGNNHYIAPMGSPAMFSAAVWGASAGLLGKVFSAVADAVKPSHLKKAIESITSGTIGEDIAEFGYDIQQNVLRAKDAAIQAMAPYTTFLFMRLGNSILGPFIVKSCSHNFDYATVDEKGYPASGTITLDIEYIFKANNYDLLSQMGYEVTYPDLSVKSDAKAADTTSQNADTTTGKKK